MRTLGRTSSLTLLRNNHKPSSQHNSSRTHISHLHRSYPSTFSNQNSQFHKQHNHTNPHLPNSSKNVQFSRKNVQNSSLNHKTIQDAFLLENLSQVRPFCSDSVKGDENGSSGHIDAGSSFRKAVSLWPGMYHSPVTNALWEARSRMYEKVPNVGVVNSDALVSRTPTQSRTGIVYRFSEDYTLREQYRNPWNRIRIGKLLEDLDALAGTISFKHCSNDDGSARPMLLVTASVDRMVLKKPLQIDCDLKMVGAVTWVGRSSMEIQLEVSQYTKDTLDPAEATVLTANFTFVARDSKTGKSATVNQISPETEQEKKLWKEADDRNKMRKKKTDTKKDVGNSDNIRLQALLAEGRVFSDLPALADRDSILIRDTCLENSFICQPQQRNIYGRIFGGFLMQKAFELAFSTAYSFGGLSPIFVEMDHVDFLKPVDVGNFLRLKSCVLYTDYENSLNMINVEVVAHVTRPELRCSEVSNKFYFTFTIAPEALKNGTRIRNVVPATEEEARRVLERMDAESSISVI